MAPIIERNRGLAYTRPAEVESDRKSTRLNSSHVAEIVALRRAARKAANYRLTDCDLFVTVEPCAMCLGAVVQARIRRLVYGAADPKAGAVRSTMRFPFDRLNHRPEIVGGVRADEASGLLREFFRARRKRRAFRL